MGLEDWIVNTPHTDDINFGIVANRVYAAQIPQEDIQRFMEDAATNLIQVIDKTNYAPVVLTPAAAASEAPMPVD